MPLHRSTGGVHTCHADCPCQRGGEPLPDFVDGTTLEKRASGPECPLCGQPEQHRWLCKQTDCPYEEMGG